MSRTARLLQPAAYGDHAGGRVLYGYAAQLAFARWTPPPMPDLGPRLMSRSILGRIAASEAGRSLWPAQHGTAPVASGRRSSQNLDKLSLLPPGSSDRRTAESADREQLRDTPD
ncbi:hypothetical protein ACIBEA_43190 [Streptomyces sp. NPDC051555]|uniref:hypothetical protein n=1 Tax=Streptomyces sp. NPDC051555 TaxID=3365657 RepID=UPI0037B08D8E